MRGRKESERGVQMFNGNSRNYISHEVAMVEERDTINLDYCRVLLVTRGAHIFLKV